MNAPARLGVFGLGLAVVFGAAMGAGHLTGPVTFYAEAPSAGTYRLSLDFQHHGAVHTAEFTAVAKEA